MESEKLINQNNIEKYIHKFENLSPSSKVTIEKFQVYWKGEDDLPFTSLFSNIGTAIACDIPIFDEATCSEIFSHIELGMNSDDEYLATAVATGLVEALVNASDDNSVLWHKIESHLGFESKKHALAWKNFGQ